eukprot:TRINITY_DN55199_c0_g1_i1.p1 TRINITY_DN55199_c0_g1~~TRINITY_DN55199_c0_g1_i1.p1  ORF type:complete len:179 (-),score=32.18 TRINITY_DN55199_c0_g1_i1:81-578(-)
MVKHVNLKQKNCNANERPQKKATQSMPQPTVIKGRRIFRNFLDAHTYYGFPATHRTGTIGNKEVGVIRSFSANHEVDGKDKDRFDFGKSRLERPQRILYRLKDEKIRSLFKINQERGTSLYFFKRLAKDDADYPGVWDMGKYLVAEFAALEGAKFVMLVPEVKRL